VRPNAVSQSRWCPWLLAGVAAGVLSVVVGRAVEPMAAAIGMGVAVACAMLLVVALAEERETPASDDSGGVRPPGQPPAGGDDWDGFEEAFWAHVEAGRTRPGPAVRR
jgi:hypothetical protein